MTPDETVHIVDLWLEAETFVTMNRFHGPRRVANLAELNALFLDLDIYRIPELSGRDIPSLLMGFEQHWARVGLPSPSFFIDSGRGAYAIWLHDPLPAAAHSRWSALLRHMIGSCANLGADPACSDATRILRVPGSVNSKVGRTVTVLSGNGRRFSFDNLEDRYYLANGRPTRGELKRRRKQVAKKERQEMTETRGLSPRRRFEAVRRDLERLLAAWGGQVPTGYRNSWLHLFATALGHTDPGCDLASEIESMASRATPGLRDSEIKALIRSARKRAENARSDAQSPLSDGSLHYSGARMAELLDVNATVATRLGLEQVIPPEIRAERKAQREAKRRRAAGKPNRQEWLAMNSKSQEEPWTDLGVSRATYYRRGLHRRRDDGEAPETDETGACPQQGGSATRHYGADNARSPRKTTKTKGSRTGRTRSERPEISHATREVVEDVVAPVKSASDHVHSACGSHLTNQEHGSCASFDGRWEDASNSGPRAAPPLPRTGADVGTLVTQINGSDFSAMAHHGDLACRKTAALRGI